MIVMISNATTNVAYWKQERLILEFDGDGDTLHFWSGTEGSFSSPVAKYTPDANGCVFVDVTEYIRAYASQSAVLYLKDEAADANLCTINVAIKGLIDPLGVAIPYHPYLAVCQILPPSKMIKPATGTIIAEAYKSNGDVCVVTGDAVVQGGQVRITGDFSLYPVRYPGPSIRYTLQEQNCELEYVTVRWQSFTGVTRVAIFERRGIKTSPANSYNLLPIDSEYVQIKGRVDEMTIGLDGLTVYDIWYYGDIVTSSKVEVADNDGKWSRVEVTTKSITVPEGNAGNDGKLEIVLNWKRYDAVS